MPFKKAIIITGASSGVGAAIAREIASSDVALLLHSRGSDEAGRQRMQEVLTQVREKGAQAQPCYADLAQEGSGKTLVEACINTFGQLDQIVSNAGHASTKSLQFCTSSDLLRDVQAMAGAFLDIAHYGWSYLQESTCASIVLTSSFVAHRFKPDELFPITSAAKAAAEAIAMTLAAELAGSNVTVNCVVPGYTRKDASRKAASDWETRLPKPPLGRFGTPADIAGAVAFLLGPHARFITGQKLAVDGGLCLG